MSSLAKKAKKRKDAAKREPKRELPPQVVTRSLADNIYSGIIREGSLGAQYLESTAAKYTWKTGLKYEGPFAASQIEGKGKFTWLDGSRYEGELYNGKRHGKGVYTAADGTTQYEGAWCLGKRHGHGRLTYTGDGSSFYEGGWKEGKKHGEGKQAWPSGNVYEGQWEQGKMRGHGTMVWKVGNTVERYVGCWEENHPHGEGTHTWHAPEPAPNQSAGDGLLPRAQAASGSQSQQLNNRYKGQWHRGRRHGVGTFYYANGSYYHGEWQDHMKHGHGRHTFDDGRVYDGPFENDRMVGPSKDEEASSGMPGPGMIDNPITRCTDIADLEVLALPQDHSGFELAVGTGYHEPKKILRAVYNVLLRHLADLRELYNRYRSLIPMQGEDPFVLSSYQFWLLARDAGLVTANCPLTRLHRAVFSGPRHHSEVAPEDVADLRKLTPRFSTDRRGSVDSRSDGEVGPPQRLSGTPSQAASQAGASDEESSMASSVPSPTHGPTPPDGGGGDRRRTHGESRPATADAPASVRQHHQHHQSQLEQLPERAPSRAGASADPRGESRGTDADSMGLSRPHSRDTEASLGQKFLRIESSTNLADIHSATKFLLFRQFLEGSVRLALVRFPHERGLEHQIHRLFKEGILPCYDKDPESEHLFAFLAQADIRRVLEDFKPVLWQLFRGEPEAAGAAEHAPMRAHPASSLRPSSGDGLADGKHHLGLPRFGGFGAPRRQLHVNARLDVTVRIKDVLQLLDVAGLLRPMQSSVVPQDDPHAQVFSPGAIEDEMPDPNALEGDDGDGSGDDDNGSGVSTSPEQESIGGDRMVRTTSTAEALLRYERRSLPALRNKVKEKEEMHKVKEKEEMPKDKEGRSLGSEREAEEATEQDFVHCNFSVPALLVLRLFAEVLSPETLGLVRWERSHMELQPEGECVSLLEYAETEIAFSEFLRLLVRIVELGTGQHRALCERIPLAQRAAGFIRHVFLPALLTPYMPPASTDGHGASSELPPHNGVADAAEAAEASQEAAEPGEATEEAGSEAGEAQPPPPGDAAAELELWRGFDDDRARAEAAQAPRRWPDCYEQEVSCWS